MKKVIIITIIISFAMNLHGSTYYISNSGNDSWSGTNSQPWLTFQYAWNVLQPGDILLVKDGIYSGTNNAFTNLPNGSSTNGYISIKAENEGEVIITSGLIMDSYDEYLEFHGFRFHDTIGRLIYGHHIKFFRNEFKGGCSTGNCSNTGIGTINGVPTSDILMEDNWFHGLGGRYNLLVYNAERIIIRRAIIRHDGGWSDFNPEAGINFYNSRNCSAQNVFVIDSDLNTYASWQAGIYSTRNLAGPAPGTNFNNSWYGCISLNNNSAPGFRLDGNGPQTDHIIKDLVVWDNGIGIGMGSAQVINISVDQATVGRNTIGVPESVGIGEFAQTWSGNITNAVVTGFDHDVTVPMSYFNTFNNNTVSSGTGRVTYDPFLNGLKYLLRIEDISSLKNAGLNSGQIGAQITNKIGVDGTLHGELGWNNETNNCLWPYPYEVRIMKEMCIDAGETRGFCSSGSLTQYLWEYLGSPMPVNFCSTTLSIEDPEMINNPIKIFPNPSTGKATIDFSGVKTSIGDEVTFILYNSIGVELIRRDNLSTNKFTFSTEGLQKGIYLYRLSTVEKTFGSGKLIIK